MQRQIKRNKRRRVILFSKVLLAGSFLTLTRDECTPPVSVSDTTINFYFKLPYISPFSVVTQKRVCQFAKCYCNSIDIELVFSSFKIGNMFGEKDLSLVGSVRERNHHIFIHLHNSPQCRTLCSDECLNTLGHAATTFQLKIKEKNIIK